MSSFFLNFFRKIKLIDIAVFAVFAAVTVYAFSYAYSGGMNRKELLVHTPRGTFAYDMSKDRIIDIEGAIGTSRIEISDGTVRFLDSPCPNKTCVQSMPISESGEWSACLPNQVFLRIEGGRSSSVDATVR
ncbi:NusG domain II-containing protein [Treponema sp. Marseille-Q4132]|uniref:NusG domain II-containing protein n=1 Tax=Treponema sp. Marseille-Q4132 TaxID=2766701 RepID=UPI0016531EEA|nr:NusG domain II-containing protein [Treponema sp. Marseille-Q4132]QNL97939.1 NusG domain II-containing protein [Treponema sp. Marseille-Q4132]